mgnify:FL=1
MQQPNAERRELFIRADEMLRACEGPTDFERVGLSGDAGLAKSPVPRVLSKLLFLS